MTKEYAVYKGDELQIIGTAEECAERLGVTPKYIRWLAMPTARRRMESRKNPENSTIAVLLDDDDEEEAEW